MNISTRVTMPYLSGIARKFTPENAICSDILIQYITVEVATIKRWEVDTTELKIEVTLPKIEEGFTISGELLYRAQRDKEAQKLLADICFRHYELLSQEIYRKLQEAVQFGLENAFQQEIQKVIGSLDVSKEELSKAYIPPKPDLTKEIFEAMQAKMDAAMLDVFNSPEAGV